MNADRPDPKVIDWLLEEENPGVRLRALNELYGQAVDHEVVNESRQKVLQSLPATRDRSWMALKGQILVYNLTALAESGLSTQDIDLEPVLKTLFSQPFDAGCGEAMALRALVMLGVENDPRVIERLEAMREKQLPDGGWLCLHRLRKMDRVPKSCIKVNMHTLLLAGELKKRGKLIDWTAGLLDYFRQRRLFYRNDDPTQLVLNLRGRRMTDVFFPSEFFHVGLPVLLEALAELGAGEAPEFQEAWALLNCKKDAAGKILLDGTLLSNNNYLPKERIGKPSKWATLYAYSAWQKRPRQSLNQGEAR